MDGDSRPPARSRRFEPFRQQMLERIPAWYSPWGHLAGTLGIGVVTLILAAPRLDAPRAFDFLTLPVAVVFSNLVEWFAHRHLMHHRRRPFSVLFDRHTPEHHRIYTDESMAIESARELRLVLIPAAGVLGIVLLAVPAALVVGALANANAGWLFLMTSAVYVVGYELSHLAYHLPESSIVYRLPLLAALREHHARHHVPELMQKVNFNVTLPLGDLLFRTIASAKLVAAIRSRRTESARGATSKTE
jgi:hypothetical protein